MMFQAKPLKAASQLEIIPWWGKNILRREGGNVHWGGQKCTKYNKINNNSKNSGGQDCCQKGLRPLVLVSCRA